MLSVFDDGAAYSIDEVVQAGEESVVAAYSICGRGASPGEELEFRWSGVTWFRDGEAIRGATYHSGDDALEAAGARPAEADEFFCPLPTGEVSGVISHASSGPPPAPLPPTGTPVPLSEGGGVEARRCRASGVPGRCECRARARARASPGPAVAGAPVASRSWSRSRRCCQNSMLSGMSGIRPSRREAAAHRPDGCDRARDRPLEISAARDQLTLRGGERAELAAARAAAHVVRRLLLAGALDGSLDPTCLPRGSQWKSSAARGLA